MLTTLIARDAELLDNVWQILRASRKRLVLSHQDCRMTREKGNRTIVAIANYSINEPIALLLCNNSLCSALMPSKGSTQTIY